MNPKLLMGLCFSVIALALAGSVYADVPQCGPSSTDARCAPAPENSRLQYVPLEPLSPKDECPPNSTGCNPYPSIGSYLNAAYSVLLTLGALFAVVTFSIGGVVYMTSDAVGNKSAAVERMKSALWGLLLLAASVLILQTIGDQQFLNFDIAASLSKLAKPDKSASPGNSSSSSATWSCIVNNSQTTQFTYKPSSSSIIEQNYFLQSCEVAGGKVKSS